jgi:hypothetical protein
METIIFAESEQLKHINNSKLSMLLPMLYIIAKQNKLKLSVYSEFKKAKHILEISIFNN